jgi:hypothetical protein
MAWRAMKYGHQPLDCPNSAQPAQTNQGTTQAAATSTTPAETHHHLRTSHKLSRQKVRIKSQSSLSLNVSFQRERRTLELIDGEDPVPEVRVRAGLIILLIEVAQPPTIRAPPDETRHDRQESQDQRPSRKAPHRPRPSLRGHCRVLYGRRAHLCRTHDAVMDRHAESTASRSLWHRASGVRHQA